jgi:hypothetical protein
MKNKELDQYYTDAMTTLGEACIAMDTLVDLVDKGLPIEDFQQFMGAISHRHAKKLLEGIKHD